MVRILRIAGALIAKTDFAAKSGGGGAGGSGQEATPREALEGGYAG